MSESRVLAITEEIYDAAAGGTPWSVVGQSLSRLVGASSAWLAVSDPQSGEADLLAAHVGKPRELSMHIL